MAQTTPPEAPAVERLAHDAGSRKRFLRMVGGGGAAAALSILVAACGDDDGGSAAKAPERDMQSSRAGGDLEIVNYALTLEFLEADFYRQVVESGTVKDRKVAELAKRIGAHEQEHVDALTATVEKLGGTPAAKPRTKFGPVIDAGPQKILETAAAVENLGAAAYLGQANRIEDTEILAAALAIHSVEARHAAALNTLVGKSIVPDGAFAKAASMDEVLAKVKPFIAS